jgi:hypothetical protein
MRRCFTFTHAMLSLDPQTWAWTSVQTSSPRAPSPSLYPVAQAGPDNSIFVYSGCAVTRQMPLCNASTLSNAAFKGAFSAPNSMSWSTVSAAASSAPVYGTCAASPWPHASFEADASFSQNGAAIMTGGITIASAFVPPLPLTAFPFDSPAALASVGGSVSPSKAAPQSRAFSACSMFGISDYFIMCATSFCTAFL